MCHATAEEQMLQSVTPMMQRKGLACVMPPSGSTWLLTAPCHTQVKVVLLQHHPGRHLPDALLCVTWKWTTSEH